MSSLRLREYQQRAIDEVRRAWERDVNRPAVVLPTGSGKGHPADTDVPTPIGWRKWGNLRPGDFVFGSDGLPTEVLDVYDRGVLPTYRVTFSDGSSVMVDSDHMWSVRDVRFRRTKRETRTLSTSDLASEGLREGRAWRFSIPMTVGVSYEPCNLPIDPYTLGALIANGYLAGTGTQLTTPDSDVARHIEQTHEIRKVRDTTDVCDRYSLPGLSKAIRKLGLNVKSADKFIPGEYLIASQSQRIRLLQGLMDGDGSSRSGGRRSVLYHTTSPQLAEDVRELVASLGGTARVRGVERNTHHEYSVPIMVPTGLEPFSTQRKRRTEQPRRSFPPKRAIVSITPEGVASITCIRVAAIDHLYLVTKSYLVTHNTVIFAHLATDMASDISASHRVLILVHRDELVRQTVDKLHSVAPDIRVGVVKAGENDVDAPIVVGSVQTLARERRREQLANVGCVIVDEAHHALAKSYRTIMESYGCFDKTPTVGFTATLARGDKKGLGDVWEEVVYTRSILKMISEGYLVDVKGVQIGLDTLHLNDVKKSGGDYQAGALGEALMAADASAVVAEAYRKHCPDRSGILFAPTVAVAHEMADVMGTAGFPTEVITGDTPTEDRQLIYKRFKSGDTQVLASCMVLTEGFDAPWAEVAVIARPTQSQPLYVQMVGRVLRTWPGKKDALVLDVVGAGDTNRLMTLVDLAPGRVKKVEPNETLAEAAEREQRDGPKTTRSRTGEADLFAASRSAWLRTPAGVDFIPVRTGFYFLWPSESTDGLWDVGYQHTARHEQPRTERTYTAMSLEYAMAWAESDAMEDDPTIANRSASWRKKKVKPTEPQIGYARSMGIRDAETLTKPELSDQISIVQASRLMDRYVR